MRKYQVFVSSTFDDLVEERQECIRALLELDCIPAGMEMFPASTDDAWTLIKRVIKSSDYFVLISKGKYGSIHPKTNIGYTEMEYDYAVSLGIPVVAFLWQDLDELPVASCESNEEAIHRLEAFRAKAKERVVKWWAGKEQLSGSISRSVATNIRVRPGVGWIRSSEHDIADQEAYIKNLKERTAALERAIDELKQADPLKKASTQVKESYKNQFKGHKFLKRIPCFEALDFIYKSLPGHLHLSGYVELNTEKIEAFFGETISQKKFVFFLKTLSGFGLIRKKKKKAWDVLPYGKQIKSLLEIGY